jgi:hypothetical protein
MKRLLLAMVLVALVLGAVPFWTRLTVHESGEGFDVGDDLVLAEYGYSGEGDRLRFAIFRTWPRESTPEERSADPRTARDFIGWPLIRDHDGRMVPVGTDGNVYFFEGDTLKTMKVRMNEHTDTIPLGNSKTLGELWSYLQQFQVRN